MALFCNVKIGGTHPLKSRGGIPIANQSPPTRYLLQTARNLGIGLSIAGLLLAGLEGVLRVSGFEYHTPRPIVIWYNLVDHDLQRLEVMYRFHPYWFWEPRPGARIADFWELMLAARGVTCGTELINSAGYRGPERPQPPAPGKLRIAIMGDSSTFGMGVCWDDTYGALLERALPNAEVLNFGVIGFSAFQGEKLLEGRILSYRPRVILAAFGTVNELLPAGAYEVDTKFRITSQASPRAVLWHDRLNALRTFQLVERALARKPDASIERRARDNWEKFTRGSRDYLRNQSVASFERSLERIVTIGQSRGARVVLIGPPRRRTVETRWPWAKDYSAAIERVASRLNTPYWDARAAFRAIPDSDERLFLDDFHPNIPGHQLYARFLAEKILHDLGFEGHEGSTR